MRERKKIKIQTLFAVFVAVFLCFTGIPCVEVKGASDYDDAREFFENTGGDSGKHIRVVDATIYFATKARLAHTYARDGFKYYHTLGYDVTLTGNGKSVTFSVKRGGSLEDIESANRIHNGFEYILYRIPTDTIFALAQKADPTNASTVLSADKIKVRMDAIITVRQNGMMGSLVEDGKGGLVEYPEHGEIFHLKNPEHLSVASSIFNGTTFYTYIEIEEWLDNFRLGIMYNIGEGAKVNAGGYHTGTFTQNGVTLSDMLYDRNGIVQQSYKLLQDFKLLDTGRNGLNLSKTGYHLVEGKEWKRSGEIPFSVNKTYMPKEILPEVGYGSRGVVLYANWKPNPYQIIYDADGGRGTVAPSSMVYDDKNENTSLRANTYEKDGYYLPLGEEWIDTRTGKSYASGESGERIKNLTSEYNGKVVLKANWQPRVYAIETDRQGGSGGTDSFHEKYGEGFYSDGNTTNEISEIMVPTRRGYEFKGYYNWINGGLPLIVASDGTIKVKSTFFLQDSTIYGKWQAKQYPITFDKQGGEYGSDTAMATFEQLYPIADPPVRDGYSFKGYYTEEQGQGECIYTEFMVTDKKYTHDSGITLYAYWVDDIRPEVTLFTSADTWTKETIILTADARDLGSGLKSLVIYKIGADGSLTEMPSEVVLNGTHSKRAVYANATAGIVRYRAVATDNEGNSAECYAVVYYDTKAPHGTVITEETEFGDFYIEIDITDIDTGD